MYVVLIHIFLLLIQLENRQDDSYILVTRHIALAEVTFQIADIPMHVAKLFSHSCLYLLFGRFPALCKSQIVFSRFAAIVAGEFQSTGFTHTVYHVLQFFSCLIKQGYVLRIPDIDWSTDGVNGQDSFVSLTFSGKFSFVSFPENDGSNRPSSLAAKRYSFASHSIFEVILLRDSTRVLASNGRAS